MSYETSTTLLGPSMAPLRNNYTNTGTAAWADSNRTTNITPESSPLSSVNRRHGPQYQLNQAHGPDHGQIYSLMTKEEEDAVKERDVFRLLSRIKSSQSSFKSIQSYSDIITPHSLRQGGKNASWNSANDFDLNANANANANYKCSTPRKSSLAVSPFATMMMNNHNMIHKHKNNRRSSLAISLDELQKILLRDDTSSKNGSHCRFDTPLTTDLDSNLDLGADVEATTRTTTNSNSFHSDNANSNMNMNSNSNSSPTTTINSINPLDSSAPYFSPSFAQEYQCKLQYLVDLMEESSRTRKGFEEAKRGMTLEQQQQIQSEAKTATPAVAVSGSGAGAGGNELGLELGSGSGLGFGVDVDVEQQATLQSLSRSPELSLYTIYEGENEVNQDGNDSGNDDTNHSYNIYNQQAPQGQKNHQQTLNKKKKKDKKNKNKKTKKIKKITVTKKRSFLGSASNINSTRHAAAMRNNSLFLASLDHLHNHNRQSLLGYDQRRALSISFCTPEVFGW